MEGISIENRLKVQLLSVVITFDFVNIFSGGLYSGYQKPVQIIFQSLGSCS